MRSRDVLRFALVGSLAALTGLGSVAVAAQDGTPEPEQAAEASPPADNVAPDGAPPAPPPPAGATVVAFGLNNPRGLEFGPDGLLYVAEAGADNPDEACITGPEGDIECYGNSSSISRVTGGTLERVAENLRSRATQDGSQATGAHDVAFQGDVLYTVVGLGADPGSRADFDGDVADLGRLVRIEGGTRTDVADISDYEATVNPDAGDPDSNPYSLAALADGSFVIADAGANALLRVTADGAVSTLAVFPDRLATGPDGSELPMQAVPNAVTVGPDGAYYVGQLTGFPFPQGGANVYRVAPEGGEPEVVHEGFTNIIDLHFDPEGNLYVLEFNKGGLLTIDPANPASLEGQLTRIAPDGGREVFSSSGLIAPTGVTVGPDGGVYVSIFGVLPGIGQVIRFDPTAAQPATPTAATPAATPMGGLEMATPAMEMEMATPTT